MSQKLNKSRHNSSCATYAVPGRIARHIPDDAYFDAELTEEGILLRFVGRRAKAKLPDTPTVSWLNGSEV